MKYNDIVKGKFIERPNRFVALCEIGGRTCRVHVKNTGRCRELLVPGADVWLEDHAGRMGTRKLRYSLIAVRKKTEGGSILINMDSQAPNPVAEEAAADGRIRLPGMGKLTVIKREKTFGNSRFDLYFEDDEGRKGYGEVKGVTLEKDGVAYFPDAPTVRGVKHVEELSRARREGFMAYIIFIIQMNGIIEFRPNDRTHPEFGEALRKAAAGGVEIMAFQCDVAEDVLKVKGSIRVRI